EHRLRLAGELHDFVAHDVSEIVARAQAGRAVLAAGEPKLAKLLEQIETAGIRALESMDRTVHMLRDDDGDAARAPVAGLDDIDELARRFTESERLDVTVDRRLSGPVGRESAAVAHRAVVEALTNVRRHARSATKVAIELSDAAGRLRVSVADDGRGGTGAGARSSTGMGLAAMAERAASLGGTVDAGAGPGGGWRVTV
ncbi:sensor histidine kinase, partial [Glycomyces tenuis]